MVLAPAAITINAPDSARSLKKAESFRLVGEVEMKAEGGGKAEQGQGCGRVGQLPAEQNGNAGAELERDHQRQQETRNMVHGHMIEERLRAGDFRCARKNE